MKYQYHAIKIEVMQLSQSVCFWKQTDLFTCLTTHDNKSSDVLHDKRQCET
jgi:hypothetical protein